MTKIGKTIELFSVVLAENVAAARKEQVLNLILSDINIQSRGEPFRYEKAWSYLTGVSVIAKINEADLSRWLKLVPEKNRDLRIFFEHLKTLNSGIKHLSDVIPRSSDSGTYYREELFTSLLAMRGFQLYRQALLARSSASRSMQLDPKSPLHAGKPEKNSGFKEEVDSVVKAQIDWPTIFNHSDSYSKYNVFAGLSAESQNLESSLEFLQQAIVELRALYKSYKKANLRGNFPSVDVDEKYKPTPEIAFAAQSYHDYIDYAGERFV